MTLLGLGVVGVLLMTASCGKTSATFSDPPPGSGGASGTTTAGRDPGTSGAGRGGSAGSSLAGMSAAAGTAAGMSSSGGGAGTAAMGGGGGTSAASGAGAGGTATVEGGASGASGVDAPLGVDCGAAHCAVGDVCVYCSEAGNLARLCVPHPLTQPDAYAKATANCQPAPFGFDECDGPEDCPSDQYCVAHDGEDGRQRCRASPAPGFCCFTCNALVNCTLCRDDGDCPDAQTCSVVFEDVKGCARK